MYRASLRQLDPGDPKWGAPPLSPPDMFVSVLPATGDKTVSPSVRRWPSTLIAYDWTINGRQESLRPEDPFDTSIVDTPVVQGVDKVRFEIHSVAMPTSITVMRVFDLGAGEPL